MTVTRPVFTNGAILGAADLSTLAELDRDRDARHARHLHSPGVGAGLEVTKQDRATADEPPKPYVELTLQPGYAIDGSGRELVLGQSMPLSSERFFAANPNPPADLERTDGVSIWHPVFVRGSDQALANDSGPLGCQGVGGPTRVNEDVEIEYGGPGDERLDQTPPAPDAGPDDGDWLVLICFVRVDPAIRRLVDVATSVDGVEVESAGLRAETVIGRAGKVELRAGSAAEAGVPAMVVSDGDGGSLVFGLHDGAGGVSALLEVDSSGNLQVEGTLSGNQTAGSLRLASGVAGDGVILPLPAGVDQQSVDDGATVVTVLLVARAPDPRSAPLLGERFISAVCRIDGDRRLECWGSWFAGGAFTDVSTACDYVVMATVPEGGS